MPRYEAATSAAIGSRRNQEDCAAVDRHWIDDEVVFAVLADGMGGHAGGAIASKLVCDSFQSTFAERTGSIEARLIAALDAANEAVAQMVRQQPGLLGMGSTAVGAVFSGDGLAWISVGDSPLYLYRRGEIALLNEDHSLAPALDQLAAAGKITLEAARNDPRRHMLRSAVMGEELELVDLARKVLPLAAGDYVILASDGIHTLDEGAIAASVATHADHGPQRVADALVEAVLAAGETYQDNVTIVAVRCS